MPITHHNKQWEGSADERKTGLYYLLKVLENALNLFLYKTIPLKMLYIFESYINFVCNNVINLG